MYHFHVRPGPRKVERVATAFRQCRVCGPFTHVRHTRPMDIVPTDLGAAALGARDRLADLSRLAAADGTGADGPRARTAMAGAAREAIFADALFSAMHARFEELKSITK